MNIIKILILTFFTVFAHAGDIEFSWDLPVEREDGTVLTNGEIAGFRIYHKLDNVDQPTIDLQGAVTSHRITGAAVGVHIFEISTVADVEGETGGPTSATVAPPPVNEPSKPLPPEVIIRVIVGNE